MTLSRLYSRSFNPTALIVDVYGWLTSAKKVNEFVELLFIKSVSLRLMHTIMAREWSYLMFAADASEAKGGA